MLNYRRMLQMLFQFRTEWPYLLEAVCALPAIFLVAVEDIIQSIWIQEKDLAKNGEFDEEENPCKICSHCV